MEPLLDADNLLGYAEGTIPAPSQTVTVKQGATNIVTPNLEYHQWLMHDRFCLTSILVHINSEIGVLLVAVSSIAEAWNKLLTLFDSQHQAQKDLLNQQWVDRFNSDRTMVAYLTEVTDLVNRFAQFGHPKFVSNDNAHILTSLSDEWEPLYLALAPTLHSMTTDWLKSLLLNQEANKSYKLSWSSAPLFGLTTGVPNVTGAGYFEKKGGDK